MSRIQITDLNSSDFGFLSELTDEEMSGINGRGWWIVALAALLIFRC